MKVVQKSVWVPYVLMANAALTIVLGVLIAFNINGQKQDEAESTTAADWFCTTNLERQLPERRRYEPPADAEATWFQPSLSGPPSRSYDDDIEDLQAQINILAAKVNSNDIMTTVHCEPVCILPPHVPNGGFSVRADFLYWQADESGLEYGTKMTGGPLIGEPSTTSTKLLDLHFDWNPGFHVGIGYTFECFDFWSLNLDWTRIVNHAHGHAKSEGVSSQTDVINTIIPTWVNLLDELREGASSASAHWHVDYDTLDLALERSFFLSRQFVLSPYVGFRSAWIDQHYRATYDMVFIDMEGEPPFTQPVYFKAKNDFWGFGPRLGSELIWHFNQNWNIFANFSGSILYGKFKVNMQNLNDRGIGEGATPPAPLNFTASEHFWRGRLNFEEAIGIGWETFFHCDQFHVSCRASYELSQWLNQNELYYTFFFRGTDSIINLPVKSKGNLSFQGVRAGLQFDF